MAMLQGIQGANNVQEKAFGSSSFAPLPAGGYVCRILAVGVDKTSGGKQFIKLRIDVAEGEHAGYFQKRFQADASSQYGQKWKGVYKIWLPTFSGDNDKYTNAIAMYKGQLNTISRANHLPEPNIEAGFDPDMFKGSTLVCCSGMHIIRATGSLNQLISAIRRKSAAVTLRFRNPECRSRQEAHSQAHSTIRAAQFLSSPAGSLRQHLSSSLSPSRCKLPSSQLLSRMPQRLSLVI